MMDPKSQKNDKKPKISPNAKQQQQQQHHQANQKTYTGELFGVVEAYPLQEELIPANPQQTMKAQQLRDNADDILKKLESTLPEIAKSLLYAINKVNALPGPNNEYGLPDFQTDLGELGRSIMVIDYMAGHVSSWVEENHRIEMVERGLAKYYVLDNEFVIKIKTMDDKGNYLNNETEPTQAFYAQEPMNEMFKDLPPDPINLFLCYRRSVGSPIAAIKLDCPISLDHERKEFQRIWKSNAMGVIEAIQADNSSETQNADIVNIDPSTTLKTKVKLKSPTDSSEAK